MSHVLLHSQSVLQSDSSIISSSETLSDVLLLPVTNGLSYLMQMLKVKREERKSLRNLELEIKKMQLEAETCKALADKKIQKAQMLTEPDRLRAETDPLKWKAEVAMNTHKHKFTGHDLESQSDEPFAGIDHVAVDEGAAANASALPLRDPPEHSVNEDLQHRAPPGQPEDEGEDGHAND